MKRCPSCGMANAKDAAFCIHCGFGLSAVTSNATGPSAEGSPAPPGAYLSKGTVVDGKYEIERVLGEGGMGVVYLARDVHTETPVVVKSIRAELAGSSEFRARTLAEGRALARIDHPNVVRLNAVVVEPRGLYLVMQFIDGESLDRLIARWIDARAPVPLPLALSIFRMVLRGVGAAHAEGLIHRDLKPANVLVRAKDGVAKVTDFGIAKGEEDAKAGRGVTRGIIGSLAYMAPEQVRGQRDLDKRVDIYALGIVLFELLTGRSPFEAPSDYELMRMQTEMPLPAVSSVRHDLPAALDTILKRACAKDRASRFATTDAFLAALDRIEDSPGLFPLAAAVGTVRPNPVTELATQFGPPPFVGPPAAAVTGTPGAWAGPPPGAVAHTETGDGAAVPLKPRSSRRAGLWIGAGVVAIAAAATATALYIGGSDPARKVPRSAAPATSPVPTATPPSQPPEKPPDPSQTVDTSSRGASITANSPLAALAGPWKSSSNRDYSAVLAGDTLQFRIQKASQHPRQGYEDGEIRFAIAAVPGSPAEFAVIDNIRPTPPPGYEYDPKTARESCIGTWTHVQGHRLTARLDGASALLLELAQIRTGAEKFKTRGNLVVSCADVASSVAQAIESRVTRVK